MGLKVEENILKLEPCIPSEWKEYSIRYKYGTSIYNIRVTNANGKTMGVEKLMLNGEVVKDKEVRLEDNGEIYNVEVEI